MPERSPGSSHCGAALVGWVNGAHPIALREEKQVQICFDLIANCDLTIQATIRNCGAYFVYNLKDVVHCGRYCGV